MASRRKRTKRLLIFYFIFTILIVGFTVVFVTFSSSDKKKLRTMGIDAFKSGRYDDSINYFKEALSEKQWFSKKLDDDIKLYMAASYMRLNDYSEAYRLYSEINEESSNYIKKDTLTGLLNLSKTLMDTTDERYGYTDADLSKLQKFAESGNSKMYLYLASIYEHNGNLDEMKTAVEAYLDTEKDLTYTSYLLSSYYLEKNDTENARKYIDIGLSCDDGLYDDLILFNDAVYYEKLFDYNTAFEKISALHNSYPDNQGITDEYNVLYTRVKPDTQFVHTASDADYFD